VILVAIGVLFGVPVLWAVSVGALRDARAGRAMDPRAGCQAWVAVPGMPGRRYRCAEPRYAGGPWCRRHEVAHARGLIEEEPEATLIDEPAAVGRAVRQARIGVPLAVLTVAGTVALLAWALQRVS
jgi:hypothetical protein